MKSTDERRSIGLGCGILILITVIVSMFALPDRGFLRQIEGIDDDLDKVSKIIREQNRRIDGLEQRLEMIEEVLQIEHDAPDPTAPDEAPAPDPALPPDHPPGGDP